METRKAHTTKSSELPKDFVKMVNEIFTTNFDSGLKALRKIHPKKTHFATSGKINATEITFCVSLVIEGQLAATTIYASVDYDPKASVPTIQDLLGACVDAVGSLYGELLNPKSPKHLEQIVDPALTAMENVPFEWTPLKVDRYQVYLKVDKSNPLIDQMAEDWLEKNDPKRKSAREEEQSETEKLFVTGPKGKSGKGDLH